MMYGHLSWLGWLIIFILILFMSYNNLSGGEPYLGSEDYLQSPPTWETINLCLYAVFLCSNFLTTREARDFIIRFGNTSIPSLSHFFIFRRLQRKVDEFFFHQKNRTCSQDRRRRRSLGSR